MIVYILVVPGKDGVWRPRAEYRDSVEAHRQLRLTLREGAEARLTLREGADARPVGDRDHA